MFNSWTSKNPVCGEFYPYMFPRCGAILPEVTPLVAIPENYFIRVPSSAGRTNVLSRSVITLLPPPPPPHPSLGLSGEIDGLPVPFAFPVSCLG